MISAMLTATRQKRRPESHGKRGLDRLILGSVSDGVAWHARCSVEIVRAAPNAA
jgi:nucleotide-binding universal stress UspA family protein